MLLFSVAYKKILCIWRIKAIGLTAMEASKERAIQFITPTIPNRDYALLTYSNA